MVLYMSIDDHDFEYELSKDEIADFLVDQMLKESGVDNMHSTRKVVRYMIDTLDLVYDEDFLSNYTEEIKEYFYEEIEEAYRDAEEQSRDPLGYVGMSQSDFI